MIEEKRIRVYDSDHTNDPKEGIYFDKGIGEAVDFEWVRSEELKPAYIASFVMSCPKGNTRDHLVYWRTYGHNGTGCSIEFFAEGHDLKQVLYGPEQRAETFEVLDSLFEQLKSAFMPYSVAGILAAKSIEDALSTIRYLYKSDHYKYEQECRRVLPRHEANLADIRFDNPSDHIYPPRVRHYCYTSDLMLKEILEKTGTTLTLGPAVYSRETTRRSIRTAIDVLGVMGVDIQFSKIDYQAT